MGTCHRAIARLMELGVRRFGTNEKVPPKPTQLVRTTQMEMATLSLEYQPHYSVIQEYHRLAGTEGSNPAPTRIA